MKQLIVFLSSMACLLDSSTAKAAFAFPLTHKVADSMKIRQMVKVTRFVSYPAAGYKGLSAKKLSTRGWVEFSLKNSAEVTQKKQVELSTAASLALLFSQVETSFLEIIDILLFITLTVALKIVPKR